MPDPTTTQSQDAPPVAGQPPEKKEVTYTEAEYRKAVSDEKAQSGRLKTQLEAVTKERDSLKSQADEAKVAVEDATATLKETEGRIADLEADLEQALGEAPDLAEINKIKRALRAEKEQLAKDVKASKEAIAAEKNALTTERETWAATVAEAQAANFEVDTFEIAEDYEGGDWDRLKALCEKANVRKREDIRSLADVLWHKKGKGKESEGKPFIPDSGVTSGGGINWGGLSPKDRVKEADRLLRQK